MRGHHQRILAGLEWERTQEAGGMDSGPVFKRRGCGTRCEQLRSLLRDSAVS